MIVCVNQKEMIETVPIAQSCSPSHGVRAGSCSPPPNLYVEALRPSTSEGDYIWK